MLNPAFYRWRRRRSKLKFSRVIEFLLKGRRSRSLGRFAIPTAASLPHGDAVAGCQFDPCLGIYHLAVDFKAPQCAVTTAGETFSGKLGALTHQGKFEPVACIISEYHFLAVAAGLAAFAASTEQYISPFNCHGCAVFPNLGRDHSHVGRRRCYRPSG